MQAPRSLQWWADPVPRRAASATDSRRATGSRLALFSAASRPQPLWFGFEHIPSAAPAFVEHSEARHVSPCALLKSDGDDGSSVVFRLSQYWQVGRWLSRPVVALWSNCDNRLFWAVALEWVEGCGSGRFRLLSGLHTCYGYSGDGSVIRSPGLRMGSSRF